MLYISDPMKPRPYTAPSDDLHILLSIVLVTTFVNIRTVNLNR